MVGSNVELETLLESVGLLVADFWQKKWALQKQHLSSSEMSESSKLGKKGARATFEFLDFTMINSIINP